MLEWTSPSIYNTEYVRQPFEVKAVKQSIYNTEYVRQSFEVKAVKQWLNWFLNPMLG